jgi:hypothetical protein
MMVVSRAARKTDAQSEAMMTTVSKAVRSSSGLMSTGGGSIAGISVAVAASSMEPVSFGLGFESIEGDLDACVCVW